MMHDNEICYWNLAEVKHVHLTIITTELSLGLTNPRYGLDHKTKY